MALQNRRRQTLLDEVRRRGSISTTEAALLINATPATVRGLLDELVKVGLLGGPGQDPGSAVPSAMMRLAKPHSPASRCLPARFARTDCCQSIEGTRKVRPASSLDTARTPASTG